MESIYQGWTPTEHKICIRCHEGHDNIFYQLCDNCRKDDEKLSLADARDFEYTQSINRPGGG